MPDEDGQDLAANFYKALFSNSRREQGIPYYERSAKALRFAVKKLRRKRHITLERWVNFVHYGAWAWIISEHFGLFEYKFRAYWLSVAVHRRCRLPPWHGFRLMFAYWTCYAWVLRRLNWWYHIAFDSKVPLILFMLLLPWHPFPCVGSGARDLPAPRIYIFALRYSRYSPAYFSTSLDAYI